MTTMLTRPRVVNSPPPDRARRHRRRIARADLLVVLLWATAALSVALYFAEGRPPLGSVAAVITTLGIVTGLIGTDLVLVMLVLAARIPLIDRTIGHDRAIVVHRQMGKPAFYLLLAHGALLTIGYAASAQTDVVTETVGLFGSPDMSLAYLSIGLFVAVIVTSLVAVKRRFPHEFWYVVHLLSYVAVLTALPHQFSQGTVFASGTWQRVYWIGLYVLALGAILTFRVAEPVIQSLRHRMVVDHVERIAPDAVSVHLRGHRLDQLSAQGGQYFTWRFWTGRTWWQAHPISLSAAPTARGARITIKESGAGTRRWVDTIRPGTIVTFEGPYGIFSDAARGRDRVAVFAAGIGVTPARALLENLDAGPGMVTVFIRASDQASLYLWAEVKQLCQQRGWAAYTSLGVRAHGHLSWLSEADRQRGVTLDAIAPALVDSEVYICGGDGWADAIEAEVVRRDVPADHIHRERFDW